MIRKGSLFVVLILMFNFLPLHSASATVWEYSISGDVIIREDGSLMDITGTAFIDDNKTPDHTLFHTDDRCNTPGYEVCKVQFDITYFEMNIGSEYSFTGTSGYQIYGVADTWGRLDGTGDFSSLRWGDDANHSIYMAESYEEWLAFELPTLFYFDGTSEVLEVTNPDFPLNGPIGGTFTRVGAVVPVPAAVWLFGSGLLGLIGVARRKVHV